MWEDLFRSCGTYPGMSEGPMWVRLGRKEGAVMGTVTEELTGSEAPGRGSNQDHNLGNNALPSSLRSLRRMKGRKQRFQRKRYIDFHAHVSQSTQNGTRLPPSQTTTC